MGELSGNQTSELRKNCLPNATLRTKFHHRPRCLISVSAMIASYLSLLTVNEHIRSLMFIFFPLHVNERQRQMNGLIEAQTVFWPEESSQIPHILMANFNLCVHSATIYFSFWMQSMVCRKHWSRTREYLWGEGWRKESFKPGMTNRSGCLRTPCLHKFVFGLVGYWAFWNKSTPFCVIQLHQTIFKLFRCVCYLFGSDDILTSLRNNSWSIRTEIFYWNNQQIWDYAASICVSSLCFRQRWCFSLKTPSRYLPINKLADAGCSLWRMFISPAGVSTRRLCWLICLCSDTPKCTLLLSWRYSTQAGFCYSEHKGFLHHLQTLIFCLVALSHRVQQGPANLPQGPGRNTAVFEAAH